MTQVSLKKPIKVLFVCAANRNRSPTAERVFSEMVRERGCTVYDPFAPVSAFDFQVNSAGLDADDDANELDAEMILAADYVIALDPAISQTIRTKFRPRTARLITLDVPDVYGHGSPRLIEVLREQLQIFRWPLAFIEYSLKRKGG